MDDGIRSDLLDVSDLSPRHRAILARGVRGGDGPDDQQNGGDGAGDNAGNGEQQGGENAPEGGEPADGEGTPENGGESEGGEQSAEASADLPDLPADMATAEEADLRGLYDQLQAQYDERAPQATTVAHRDYLTELRSRQSAIAEELTRRRQEAQEVAESLQQLADAPEMPDPTPALASVSQVTSARRSQAPPARAASTTGTATASERPRMAMVAGTDAALATPGQEISYDRLAEEVDRFLQSREPGEVRLAEVGGFSELDGAPAPLSGNNGASVNDRLIREAVESFNAQRRIAAARAAGLEPSPADVHTAAICGPFDILRDIPEDLDTAEPVSGMWPRRPIGRLALQMTDGVGLTAVEDGVSTWSEADQDAVDPDDSATWKPCVEVDCPTPRSVKAEAVVACLTFRNDTEMSNPERVRHFTNLLTAQRARVKEGRQLQIVDSLSSAYTYSGLYGALPTLIEALNNLIAPLNYENRANPFGYDVIIPPGLLQVLGIDRANRAFGHEQDPASVLAQLQSDLEGVNGVVTSLDASLAGQPGLPFADLNPVGDAAVDITPLCGPFRVRIVDPAAAIYGETGNLYEGVQRSPDDLRRNRAQYFVEEYFLLEKHGVQPWAFVDVTLRSDGSRAGTLDPTTYECNPGAS